MRVRPYFRQLASTVYQTFSKPAGLPDCASQDLAIIKSVSPFTMTSPERIYALIQAVEYLGRANIRGDIVECGVWRGGSMVAAAITLLRNGDSLRNLYLFDTFEGMTQPTANDQDLRGTAASEVLVRDTRARAEATEQEVRDNLAASGYSKDLLHFIRGRVEDTLPDRAPKQIALLRLDTDWYESTRHELINLFPRLVRGGVLIVDDYGHWRGARQAVDEYISEHKIPILLNRIDYTGRIAVKFG